MTTDQATAPLPREETADAPDLRKFASQYAELRLVMTPADDIPVDNRGHTRRVPGRYINFTEGYFETRDPAEIAFLEEHTNRDRLFREVTAVMPKPDSAPVLRRIVELTGRRDVDALNTLLTNERLADQREDVLDAAETAIDILGANEPLPEGAGALSAVAAGVEPSPVDDTKEE